MNSITLSLICAFISVALGIYNKNRFSVIAGITILILNVFLMYVIKVY